MPRAVRLIVPLLALASLAPLTLGAPLVPDVMNGFASATTFQILGVGAAVEGGAFDWTEACVECLIRFTTPTGGIGVIEPASANGATYTIGPGQYEIREYRGVLGIYDLGLRNFGLEVHGTGKIHKLS